MRFDLTENRPHGFLVLQIREVRLFCVYKKARRYALLIAGAWSGQVCLDHPDHPTHITATNPHPRRENIPQNSRRSFSPAHKEGHTLRRKHPYRYGSSARILRPANPLSYAEARKLTASAIEGGCRNPGPYLCVCKETDPIKNGT